MQTDNQEQSLGEMFTDARTKKGFSIAEISSRLAIKEEILAGFEQNNFICESIPTIFVQGFARRYGTFLGMPENFLTPYQDLFGVDTKNDFYKNTRVKRSVNRYSNHNHWVVYLSWIILLGSIALAGTWWWQSYQENQDNRQSFVEKFQKENDTDLKENGIDSTAIANDDESIGSANNDNIDTAGSVPEDDVSSSEVSANSIKDMNSNSATATDISENSEKSTAVTGADTKTEVKDEVKTADNTLAEITNDSNTLNSTVNPAVVDTTTAENNSGATDISENSEKTLAAEAEKVVHDQHLEIVFNGACWISIRGSNGKILTEKEYRSGDKIEFSGKAPYSLRIGAPPQVQISYNGEPVKLKIDGRVAKIKLP